jgi:hypothetical protein
VLLVASIIFKLLRVNLLVVNVDIKLLQVELFVGSVRFLVESSVEFISSGCSCSHSALQSKSIGTCGA